MAAPPPRPARTRYDSASSIPPRPSLLSARSRESSNDPQRRPPSRVNDQFSGSSISIDRVALGRTVSRERERGDEFTAPANGNNQDTVEHTKEWEEDESTRAYHRYIFNPLSADLTERRSNGTPVLQLYGISSLSPVRSLSLFGIRARANNVYMYCSLTGSRSNRTYIPPLESEEK